MTILANHMPVRYYPRFPNNKLLADIGLLYLKTPITGIYFFSYSIFDENEGEHKENRNII